MSAERDRTKIAAPDDARREIEGLVQRFARNLDVYTRPDYKETQVRVEFIDPFFEGPTIHADRKLYQGQIDVPDVEICALVYELGGLREEEKASFEGAVHRASSSLEASQSR